MKSYLFCDFLEEYVIRVIIFLDFQTSITSFTLNQIKQFYSRLDAHLNYLHFILLEHFDLTMFTF